MTATAPSPPPSPEIVAAACVLWPSPPADEALVAAFARAWHDARSAHPDLRVDLLTFGRHLVAHGRRDAASVAATRASDLYLALACGLGETAALARFERDHLREVPAFVSHLGLTSDAIDELLQALRARVLAPTERGPKILSFSGQGPLGGWVRVAAVRLALNTVAARTMQRTDDAVAAASSAPDPELMLARLHAGKAFKEAFEASLAEIPDDARTILRMHYVDGLTVDEIGVAYAVHRSTAARWLVVGKDQVSSLTRKRLRDTLKLGQRDLESVLRLVDSHLDLSLHRVLGGPSEVED